MSTLVLYYSKAGSNKYLAQKIADELNCPIEEIKPRLNSRILMMMGVNFGNRKLKSAIKDYARVILCGPIWMGKLIVPLRNFFKRHSDKVSKMIFVTCCGSTFNDKDNKFGHGLVFKEVPQIMTARCLHCEAFPIGLVMPEGKKEDPDAFMKTHLNDDNFKGEIVDIYTAFLKKLEAL